MYTQAVRRQIENLPVSETFKSQLSGEVELTSYALYLKLPEYLSPLFTGIDSPRLEVLAVNSYLYFRFVIVLEQLLAQPTGPTATQMLDCMALHEQAVRGLACLFPPHDTFWQYFQRCQQRFAAANLQPTGGEIRRVNSQEEYEEQATGKSAICFAIVHALASLGQPRRPVQPLLDCLSGIHVGKQYYSDLDDFAQDWESGQLTYAHTRVSQYLVDQGVSDAGISLSTRQHHLFASGIALEHMRLGLRHYSQSHQLAQELELLQLADYLSPQLAYYTQQCDWVGRLGKIARRRPLVPAQRE